MSKLSDIRRLLTHLRLKLIEHSAENGLSVDDPEFPRKIEELNRMNQILGLSIRDLKSSRHAATARGQNLWNIPRDQRYGPAASVADQQREINELLREAADIQRLVEGLLGHICSGNEMEGVHTVAELIGKVMEHEGGTAEQAVPNTPAYVPYSQAHLQASPETAVIMAYVAIRGLVLIGENIMARIQA